MSKETFEAEMSEYGWKSEWDVVYQPLIEAHGGEIVWGDEIATLRDQRDEALAELQKALEVVQPFAEAYNKTTTNGNRPERWHQALDFIGSRHFEAAAAWLAAMRALEER